MKSKDIFPSVLEQSINGSQLSLDNDLFFKLSSSQLTLKFALLYSENAIDSIE